MHIIEVYLVKLVKENDDNTNRYYLQGTMDTYLLYKSDKTNYTSTNI